MATARQTSGLSGVRPARAVGLAAALLVGASPVPAQDDQGIRFADRSAEWKLTFRHEDGATGRRHLPETMGSGVAWLDYDADGREDLYLVDSGPLPGTPPAPGAEAGAGTVAGADAAQDARAPGANALYRNVGGRFELAAGVAADSGYGKGVSAADYDADGHVDLYVTNWGADALYRNNGDGTFTDVTVEAGLGDRRLTSSAAWADLDADGLLDLFVVTYVDYDIATAPPCVALGTEALDYCHPKLFAGQPDILYRNLGDGAFEDRSGGLEAASSDDGKGLGLAVVDLDGDGMLDVYVANDTTPNFVYFNRGGMHFVEEGLLSGTALGDDGMPQAGMGVEAADLDGDLSVDLMVTNYALEPYNLYRAVTPSFYVDDTYVLGLGRATLRLLGYGIVSGDLDLDGDLDVAIANGHTQHEGVETAQPNQVFASRMTELRAEAVAAGLVAPPGPPDRGTPEALDWRPEGALLEEVTEGAGPGVYLPRVSRGLALGDPDGDGWPDLAVTNVAEPAQLLVNTTDGHGGALVLRLRGRDGNRHAVGARAWVTPCGAPGCRPASGEDGVGGFLQARQVSAGTSFQSQSSTDLYFGLGAHPAAHVLIAWPDGALERVEAQAGQLVLVERGRGVAAVRALVSRPGTGGQG